MSPSRAWPRAFPATGFKTFVSYHGLFNSGPFPVRSFELFSSHLGAGGAHYEIEASYPLAPEANTQA